MKRRDLLKAAAALPMLSFVRVAAGAGSSHFSRVRPGQPGWPSTASWDSLRQAVGGRLARLQSPFAACAASSCEEALAQVKDAFYIGDQPALTQSSGWAGAWTSQPSAYAVAAKSTADVVAAVNFARKHRLRLVVKGGATATRAPRMPRTRCWCGPAT